jgi:hypothetical protein
MEMQAGETSKPATRMSRGMMASIGLNIALGLLAFGLGLYAFMLNFDLDDAKRRLTKEVETRQQTERYLVETRNQLNQSLQDVEQLKSQMEYKESDAQTTAGSKPQMPVVVSFRPSLLGKGMVAVIENSSDRYLTLVLTARNPTLATARRFTLELAPGSSKDFGHLEGWQFASGDELSLFHNDFRGLKVNVP